MKLDDVTNQIFIIAYNEAKLQTHEFVTPEHILAATLFFDAGKRIVAESGGNIAGIQNDLQLFFDEQVPKTTISEPVETQGITKMFESTAKKASKAGKKILEIEDLFCAFFELSESYVVYILEKNGVDKRALMEIIADKTTEAQQPLAPDDAFAKISPFITDMTAKATQNMYDPLIGRSEIIERTEQVLLRRTKNNPIHVGEPGVGKTAVVQGLAARIAGGDASGTLTDAKVYYLDLASVIAGTKYRGDFEDRLKNILDVISAIENSIVYIDEIHTLVGAGAVSGGMLDAGGILKPYLTEGGIRFIGSTTYDEYRKFFEKDKTLARRFQKIEITEPDVCETVTILEGVKSKYGDFHNVIYKKSVLELAASLSHKYINDRFLPDKAIDVIDEAGAALRMRAQVKGETLTVTERDIEKTIALMAKIPEKTVSDDEISKLKNLSQEIKKNVFGQDEAVDTVVNAIKRSRAGIDDGEKPVASLLFVGPTGVGKTEIARTLASKLNVALLRFDMSEYQEKHSVSKLIGAPPGYVGYDEGGALTEQIRKKPRSVLLLDEIEKAHYDILNILLQVMDYGVLTDANGRKADFRNTILIMTSNAGAKDAGKKLIGFDSEETNVGAIPKAVNDFFSPEFRNRLDEIVLFNALNMEMAVKIAEKEFNKLKEKLKQKNIKLIVSKNVYRHTAEMGISAEYGAREIIRYINHGIKKELVDYILFDKKSKMATVKIIVKDGALGFSSN